MKTRENRCHVYASVSVFMIIAAGAVMITGCATSQSEFARAREQNSVYAYQSFLARYPSAPESAEARASLDHARYREVVSRRDTNSYSGYLREFPDGLHAGEARTALAELDKARERTELDRAKESRSIVALRSFIKEYPQSTFLAEAQGAIRGIEEEQEIQAFATLKKRQDYAGLQAHLRAYPSGKTATETRRLIDSFAWHTITEPLMLTWNDLGLGSPLSQEDLDAKKKKVLESARMGFPMIWAAERRERAPFLPEEILFCHSDVSVKGNWSVGTAPVSEFKAVPCSFLLKENKMWPAKDSGSRADRFVRESQPAMLTKVLWIVDCDAAADRLYTVTGTGEPSWLIVPVGSSIRFKSGAAKPSVKDSGPKTTSGIIGAGGPPPGSMGAGMLDHYGEELCGYVNVFGRTLRNGEVIVKPDGLEIQPKTESLEAR